MSTFDIEQSYKYCINLVKQHYENFPVASKLLPEEKRKYIAAIYAFSREADDIADENQDETTDFKLNKLQNWNNKLNDCYYDKFEDPVFIALNDTIKRFEIPLTLFQRLLDAFRQDILVRRYKTFEDVIKYCSNSANPVGRLVLYIFDCKDEEYMKYSDYICTGLQLANFWQDVSIDLLKDRIYIPEEDFVKFNYKELDLISKNYKLEFISLMKFQVSRTRELFDQGKKLIELVNNNQDLKKLALELKLTWLGGNEILNKIVSINYDILNHKVKLTKLDFIKLLIKAKFKF